MGIFDWLFGRVEWTPPIEAVDPWRSLNIVGESYRNSDGMRRQDEVARCRPGEAIRLVPEPNNPHDADAIAVYSCRGVQVGYIARHHTDWIGGKIKDGYRIDARVQAVTGGVAGKPSRGLLLAIRITAD